MLEFNKLEPWVKFVLLSSGYGGLQAGIFLPSLSMLGNRPPRLQRTCSKAQLSSEQDYMFHKPPPAMPRQIIGFHPVKKDTDLGNANFHVRNPQHHGIEGLLSKQKKATEAAGLAIVSAQSSAQVDASNTPSVPPINSKVDMKIEIRESIFSATSPSSACNDAYCSTDFLSVCYFCKHQIIPGRDIYMYRGDRAFCTMECRYQQIVIDECKERCSAVARMSGTTSSSKHRSRALATTSAAIA